MGDRPRITHHGVDGLAARIREQAQRAGRDRTMTDCKREAAERLERADRKAGR